MRRFARLLLSALVLVSAAHLSARADLAQYLAKPEPVFSWKKNDEKTLTGGKVYDLHLVSQEWQGIRWEHRLQLFVPDKCDNPSLCTLMNTGGSGSPEDAIIGLLGARASGSPFAVVYNVPNQPLFGGKSEDALIVHTWLKYLETGDESWPLHFPMTKAVVKAMDALQAFAKSEKLPPIKSFVVTGASKRGWTAWLVGASKDKRVKAIAPMVIDILNVRAQVEKQIQWYGMASEQIHDYTSAGLLPLLQSEKAAQLMKLEDPYSYRDIITMPKLIILGTNDRYWTVDALNLYWDGLVGPKWVAYIPNSGHGLEDRGRVINVLTAFIRSIASAKPFPSLKWTYDETPSGVRLRVTSDTPAEAARLFYATSPKLDFRDQKWAFRPMEGSGKQFTAEFETPQQGYAAVYGELAFQRDGKPFTLTTQIRVLGRR